MARTYNADLIPFFRKNELHPELLGAAGLNPFPGSVSSPRAHMFGSQMGQKPAIIHGEPARFYTGIEREYAKYLYMIKFPEDGRIIEIIRKYPEAGGYENESPITLIIYEKSIGGEVDVIEVPYNHVTHQTFGFKYIQTKEMKELYPGKAVLGGTILAHPPTLNQDGDWCYGCNLRMGLFTSEPAIEDGICISRSAAEKFGMIGYGTVELSFGRDKILLNTHGDDKNFKPWLDIGETIPPSGIIISARKFDPELAPANMHNTALGRVNQTDETKMGIPGAKIVDIKIIKGSPQHSILPDSTEEWVDKYWNKTQKFNQSIIRTHEYIKKKYGANYKMSVRWNTQVRNALFVVNAKNGAKKETYRDNPLTETLIQIQYEFIQIPALGGKYTDRQAGKAVAVRVDEDHNMPKDARGRPLDGYMCGSSTSNRMNSPRLNEIGITNCAETCIDEIREAYERDGDLIKAWEILKEFFYYASPVQYEIMCEINDIDIIRDEIEWVLLPQELAPPNMITGIRIGYEPDTPIDFVKTFRALSKRFKPLYSYLTIKNHEGKDVEIQYPILVGEMYMIALERAGHSFTATASSKRQQHGIPAKPSKAEISSSPIKDSTTRGFDEDPTRGFAALCGPRTIVEVYDRALNPEAHREECRSILNAENPARISCTVPRSAEDLDPTVVGQRIIPVTGGRIVDLRDHVLACGGIQFTMGEDTDSID